MTKTRLRMLGIMLSSALLAFSPLNVIAIATEMDNAAPQEAVLEATADQDVVLQEEEIEQEIPAADEEPTPSSVETVPSDEASVPASDEEPLEPTAEPQAVRTIMLYLCGSDLETNGGMATYNLRQILRSHFSDDGDVRFIIMTGGSKTWQLESSYLIDPATGTSPASISNEYNQLWEAKGLDAAADQHPGKLVLLDGDGISGDGANAKASKDELMSSPETLKAFINYCVANFPAQKYDLILWDHGGGPSSGFGIDEHSDDGPFESTAITFADLIDAFTNNDVTRNGGTFDIINFDACLMGNVDCLLAFAPFADYYIASPETIPGYGQEYSGWLDLVGKTPDIDTYELGKKLVDDFATFYTSGEGSAQNGTLSIIDNKKLLDTNFVSLLRQMNTILDEQVTTVTDGEYKFYDELRSARSSLAYGTALYYDLGNFVSSLGVALDEAKLSESGAIDNTTLFTALSCGLQQIMGDETIMYTRSSDGFQAGPALQRLPDGSSTYGIFRPSALSIAFPFPGGALTTGQYVKGITSAVQAMPQGESRTYIEDFVQVSLKYALVLLTGKTVTEQVDSGIDRAELTYDTIGTYGGMKMVVNADGSTLWDVYKRPLVEGLGGDAAVRPWIEPIVRQQVNEAVDKTRATAKNYEFSGGNGIEVTLNDIHKRVVTNVQESIALELPAFQKYVDEHPDDAYYIKQMKPNERDVFIGSYEGIPLYNNTSHDSTETFERDYIDWLNEPSGSWLIPPSANEWIAIKDAEGRLHVAYAGGGRTPDEAIAYVTFTMSDGSTHWGLLAFKFPEAVGQGTGTLSELLVFSDEHNYRPIMASDLQGEVSVMSSRHFSLVMPPIINWICDVPLSTSSFSLTGQNAGSVELLTTPLDSLAADVADVTGDGIAVSRYYTVKDIYGSTIDISKAVLNPVGTVTSIELADDVPSTIYNGSEQAPKVTLNGVELKEGVDYWVRKPSDDIVLKDAGTYNIILMGMGDYRDSNLVSFVIEPAPLSSATLEGIVDKTYTGSPLTQDATLTFAGATLVEGKDYSVTYQDNVEVGTATVAYTGMGNFTGTVTRTFAITSQPQPPAPDVEPEDKPKPSKPEKKPADNTQKPAANTKKALPQTGDETLPIAALGLAGAVLLAAARKLREE